LLFVVFGFVKTFIVFCHCEESRPVFPPVRDRNSEMDYS
jgi:hypothetical protein